MFCPNCGGEVRPEQIFCSRCGQRITVQPPTGRQPMLAIPPLPTESQTSAAGSSAVPGSGSRVARNIGTLGVLWIIYSALRLLPALALFGLTHFHFPFFMRPMPFGNFAFAGPLLGVLAVFTSGMAIASAIAGWGLMSYKPWARLLAIVLAFLNVFHLPLGTALAIYTLWVLLPGGAEQDYENLARAH